MARVYCLFKSSRMTKDVWLSVILFNPFGFGFGFGSQYFIMFMCLYVTSIKYSIHMSDTLHNIGKLCQVWICQWKAYKTRRKLTESKKTSHSLISIARRVNRYILPHPILQSSRIGAAHIFHQKERYTPLKLFFFFY